MPEQHPIPHILSYRDAILTPLYFIFLLILVILWKRKYYKDSPVKKYIVPAFVLKVICCVGLAFLYEFYYGYSDSQNFYTGAHEIWDAARFSPKYGLELIFKPLENCSAKAQEFAFHMSYPYFSDTTVLMFKISGFIGLFCFGTYLPISLFFTLAGFYGCWRIFMTFYEEFPQHHKLIAIACLFTPSALIWGTNIIKDPLCVFGLGLAISGVQSIMKGRFKLSNLLEIIAGSVVMLSLKDYIFYIFLAAIICALYRALVMNKERKALLLFVRVFTGIAIISVIIWYYYNNDMIEDMVLNNFTARTEVLQNVMVSVNEDQGGAAYALPNVTDYSPLGIISSYFLSLNVSLFRPYLWEVKNPMAAGNALESLLVCLFTLYLLIRTKFIGFFAFAFKKPILMFALVFTLMMAPLVGFISFNFGTLIRYKLPFIPFYYTYLLLLFASLRKPRTVPHA